MMATKGAGAIRRPGWQQQENSRGAILEAATALFAESGFDNVTIRQIEQASGVGSPTIYYFFGDKRSLYREAVVHCYNGMNATIANDVDWSLSPPEMMRHMIRSQIEIFSNRNTFTRLFVREMLDDDEAFKQLLAEKTMAPPLALWRDVLNKARLGAGDGALPFMVTSTLMGVGQMSIFRRYLPYSALHPNAEAEREAIVENLMTIILHSDNI